MMDALVKFWTEPSPRGPLVRWRIGFGLTMIAFFASWLGAWPLIAGNGVLPYSASASSFSLPMGDHHWLAAALCVIGLVAAAAFAAGTQPRITACIIAVAAFSILAYQPRARNNGDLLLGSWAALTAVYALAAPRDVWRPGAPSRPTSPWLRRMVLCQLSIVYLASVAHKLFAPDWRDGTAVGFATKFAHNVWPYLTGNGALTYVAERPWLDAALTWGTGFVELAIVFALWSRRWQLWGIAMAVALHGGISLVFDVGLFTPAMLVAVLAVPDVARLRSLRFGASKPAEN